MNDEPAPFGPGPDRIKATYTGPAFPTYGELGWRDPDPATIEKMMEAASAEIECAAQRERLLLCPAETWHDQRKELVRCTLPPGHEGDHSRMTEFWGIVWPDERSM